MVTIYDIAKATGYTAPTISKALNGTGGLSAKTRQKIIAQAQKMGYTPNMAARSLTTKRSFLIGVIFEDSLMLKGFEHPLFGVILTTFRHIIEAAGYDLLFLSKQFGRMGYIEHCTHRNVDGVIIINPPHNDKDIITLAQSGIPCVSSNEPIQGICTVLSENTISARQGIDYLISQGHTRIAYLTAPLLDNAQAALERLEGYKQSLAEHHIPFNTKLIQECPFWHSEAGYEGAKKLCSRYNNQPFTAVFAANDTLAYGAMQYLQNNGYRVPEDISIIGFDDDRIAPFTTPALTTFRQNRKDIGTISAEMLLQSIAGLPVPEIIRIPTEFIIRTSVHNITNNTSD